MTDPIARVAALLAASRRAVALTGAGISTESGIPDFRGAGGVWTRYDPEEFSLPSFLGRSSARRAYWAWELTFEEVLLAAAPNPAHRALADLEARGRLRCVITQNIDGLHHAAGSRDVIELHGTAHRIDCLACGREVPRAEVIGRIHAGDVEPRCDCGGLLKPRVVFFGEAMPATATTRAFAEAETADLLLAIGSSLVVAPAAHLVPAARRAGARLVVVNLTPTPYDDLADVIIRTPAAAALAGIAELVPGAPPGAG